MARIEPAVKKETGYVALWVGVAILPVQAVCLLLGWWNWPVLWGSLLGSVTAVGNFLLMGLTVQKALTQDKKKASQMIQFSSGGRLLMQGAVLIIAGALPHIFNLWTAIIPLVIPTFAVRIRHWKLAKDNPSPDRPAIGWDDEEEDEEA